MKFQRTLVLVPLGVVATLVLLLGTVTLGLRLRSADDPGGLPDAAALDYSVDGFGSFSPLSASFIRGVLGGVIGAPDGAGRGSAPFGTRGRVVPASATEAFKRVEVSHALTNDDRADALGIPSVPFTARTDTRRATSESGETTACGPAAGRSVWYRYKAPRNTGLIATTFGSNYATTVGVFGTGAGGSNVGCDTDVNGNAIVQFLATKGRTYLFQISGPAGGGDLVFSLDPEGVTSLVSVSDRDDAANQGAGAASVSADGRFVAFASGASNLVGGDTNGENDVFVRDRAKGTTVRASVSSSGRQANAYSDSAFISGNGRFVAFISNATNLVPGDTNEMTDAFVHDLSTRRTERVSISSSERQAVAESPAEWSGPNRGATDCGPAGAGYAAPLPGFGPCRLPYDPSLSHDGRFVAFASPSPNLVANDRNSSWDVFVRDRAKGTTERVSVNSSGVERGPDTGDQGHTAPVMTPFISGNGRFVSFRTSATNLADGDEDGTIDLFVHDRLRRTTERITRFNLEGEDAPSGPAPAPETRAQQALSFDGRYVAFASAPSDSVSSGFGDVNVFVHDRRTGRTHRVNVSSTGEEDPRMAVSRSPAISADGRYVAFHAAAGTEGEVFAGSEPFDVFVRDLRTRTTLKLTKPVDRTTCSTCSSIIPAISADGRVVAFQTNVGNSPAAPVPSAENQVYVNERPRPAG